MPEVRAVKSRGLVVNRLLTALIRCWFFHNCFDVVGFWFQLTKDESSRSS